ncbi:MAG: MFS transporter [Nocardia sp.]|nr:MFS transporter [Nocardia sp.]
MPLLGQLPEILDTEPSNATWVVTASLLASAVTTPVAGRLGDLLGKRPVLVGSVVPLVIGSVICAVSSSLWPMLIGRGLQGMGVGLIPVGIAALRDLLPPAKLGSGIALISSSLGVGGALGLPLAAAVVEYSSWRYLFWGVAALAAVAGALIFFVVPSTPPRAERGRFDVLGALGLGAALVCLLLAVSKGASWGWTSATTISLFVAAVVVLLLWGVWELRSRDPLVDLRVTARPRVLLTNAASIVIGMSMFAQALIFPQLLQLPEATGYGLGQSMVAMGLWMAPGGLMMMLSSPLSAKLSALAGPKVTLVFGAVIIAAGYGTSVPLMGKPWGLMVGAIIISLGVGFAYGAMPALIMSAVPITETSAANSFNTLMRSIGTSVASAAIGAVLAEMSTTFAGGISVPTENGFKVGILIGCGVAAAAAVLALTIPTAKRAAAAAVAHSDAEKTDTVHAMAEAVPAAPAGLSVEAERVVADAEAGAPNGERAPAPRHAAPEPASFAATGPNGTNGSAGTAPQPSGSGSILFGRVNDARGIAVAGATLTLISPSGQQLGRALSGQDGFYELAAPAPGSYVLIASAEGRRPDASTAVLGSNPVSYDVTLTTLASLAGTVARTGDGGPVAGATVTALDMRGEVLAAAESDGSGVFDLAGLPEGEFTVAVSAFGYHPTAVSAQVSSRETALLEVLLRPGVRVAGVVRGGGRPLAEARVTLTDSLGNVIETRATDSDGSYAFGNLDEGTYTVVATGYAPSTAQVHVGEHDVEGLEMELRAEPLHGSAGSNEVDAERFGELPEVHRTSR